ncbi:diguanylate cyclase domain-containing protein [Acetobacterium woodii]|uniref:Stage 0 sporulation protein A homolog n=1 Tax=Acetobacterium woodii (strain ATCC 29683 / DSM 1030 / JCM 2381 / KCTC 1655 / WB1) TaxID=931626 RepID=H6LH75_ACEWD|nr:diguanylate cyclase [Acetobacterium woodii]AFA48413.1 response regulator receiver modulated diguanylate cyclase [Acetobacterium woodii DSM 1030]
MKGLSPINEKSDEHLNNIFLVSSDYLCITDVNGIILKVNPVWENNLGYSTSDLESKKLTDFFHPEDKANFNHIREQLGTQNEILDFNSRLRSKDETYRHAKWQFRFVDTLIYASGQELSAFYNSNKTAELDLFEKNRVTSILSNEILAPLESLTLFSKLLKKTQTIADQTTCLENIQLSSQLLEDLINAIIWTDSGVPITHDVISFNFYTIVENAIIPLIVRARRRNINIKLSIHAKTPQLVMGDPNRLKQIVAYLVLNSLERLEQGTVFIDITPEDTIKTVFKVYFSIRTIGILNKNEITDYSDFITNFNHDEFSQMNNPLSFGLELVKSLVNKMNGHLLLSQNNDDEFIVSFDLLLLLDQTAKNPEKTRPSSQSLSIYNQNTRLKAEELRAIEQIRKGLETNKKADTPQETPKQRLLIVDDATENTELLAQTLNKNYELLIANNGKDALALAQTSPRPDMILLDLSMPGMNGYDVSKEIHLEEATKDIPIIFLTTISDAENEVYELNTGAIDFISKPFDLKLVEEKIRNHLALQYFQDILNQTSDMDALTQISNRRRFDETLAIETRKAKRMKSALSIIMIDIDYFRPYNETYGFWEGDACLQEIAFSLKKPLRRAGDLIARWSGQQFVCLLPDTDSEGALHVAKNLKQTISNLKIPHQSSPIEKIITISLGVATGTDTIAHSYDRLLDDAQIALHNAKQSGRNQITRSNK